jgi:hypothetical protein
LRLPIGGVVPIAVNWVDIPGRLLAKVLRANASAVIATLSNQYQVVRENIGATRLIHVAVFPFA